MRKWNHQKAFALWTLGVFTLGLVTGGWFTITFLFPGSPPSPTIPLASLLETTHTLLDKGDLDEAEKSYQSILVRDPGSPEAITHLGNIAFKRGDVETALLYYDEALRRDPAYAHALWDKGIALRTKGDDGGAIAAWETFARLFPPDSADVVQVNKWIAEAKGRMAASTLVPPKSFK